MAEIQARLAAFLELAEGFNNNFMYVLVDDPLPLCVYVYMYVLYIHIRPSTSASTYVKWSCMRVYIYIQISKYIHIYIYKNQNVNSFQARLGSYRGFDQTEVGSRTINPRGGCDQIKQPATQLLQGLPSAWVQRHLWETGAMALWRIEEASCTSSKNCSRVSVRVLIMIQETSANWEACRILPLLYEACYVMV